MKNTDRIWIRIFAVLFVCLIIGLAYVGYQLGQDVERQTKQTQNLVANERKRNDLQQQEINLLKKGLENLRDILPVKDGENGKDGRDGKNGVNGTTTIENREIHTTIEKQIAVEPLPGFNGKTPEFAIDGNSHKLLWRYQGDDEWVRVPVLCEDLTVICQINP